jgi:hypothetical protein
MPSKLNPIFYGAALLLGAWSLASAGGLPVATPLDRYQPMLDQSPFALATQAATPPPVTDNDGFAKDLVLIGVARLTAGEFVSISSRDQTQRFALSSGESYNGITVASVAWSDAMGKTKVTLKKGSEYGVIGFDEALLAAATKGPAVPPGANGQPVAPGGQAPNINRGNNLRPPNAQMPQGRRGPRILSAPPAN